MKISTHSFLVVSLFVLASCGDTAKEKVKENAEAPKPDSSYSVQANHMAIKTFDQLTAAKGILGVFDVPEMLTIAKMDSTEFKNVSALLAKDYSVIQKDIAYIKAEVNGAAGAIYYNNDTSNFKFECIVPILKMPTVKPKNSEVVVLEASHMLIYNYYGPYENLYLIYDEIRNYIKDNKIEQTGPLREFYITDPSKQKDPSQWLTRIMVPVK